MTAAERCLRTLDQLNGVARMPRPRAAPSSWGDGAQETLRQLPTLDNQFVKRLLEMAIGDRQRITVFIGREKRGLPKQLTNKGATCPRSTLDEGGQIRIDGQAPTV